MSEDTHFCEDADVMTYEITVPREKVKFLIGPGGSIIKHLRKHCKMHMWVEDRNRDDEYSIFRLRPYKELRSFGKAWIDRMIGLAIGYVNYLCTDMAWKYFEVEDSDQIGWLIGRGGQYLKKVQEKCSVIIISNDPHERVLNLPIFGLPTDVARAFAKMHKRLSKITGDQTIPLSVDRSQYYNNIDRVESQFDSGTQNERNAIEITNHADTMNELYNQMQEENQEQEKENNPTTAPGMHQSSAKKNDPILQEEFNAKDVGFFTAIHLPSIEKHFGRKLLVEDNFVKITSGSDKQAKAVHNEVKKRKVLIEIMRQYIDAKRQSKRDPDNANAIMNADENRRNKLCLENNISFLKIEIPDNGSLIIGRHGQTIKQVQKDSGTFIISYVENESGYLEVFGSKKNIDEAKRLICEIHPGARNNAQPSSECLSKKCIFNLPIREDQTGLGYENLFRRCAHKPTNEITLEETELYFPFQFSNLEKFCEAMRALFPQGRLRINLKTIRNDKTTNLFDIQETLKNKGIDLSLTFPSEHVRKFIDFHNGCTVILHNGIDIYKRCRGRLEDRVLDQVKCRSSYMTYLYDEEYQNTI